jgi:hypothetical protein
MQCRSGSRRRSEWKERAGLMSGGGPSSPAPRAACSTVCSTTAPVSSVAPMGSSTKLITVCHAAHHAERAVLVRTLERPKQEVGQRAREVA